MHDIGNDGSACFKVGADASHGDVIGGVHCVRRPANVSRVDLGDDRLNQVVALRVAAVGTQPCVQCPRVASSGVGGAKGETCEQGARAGAVHKVLRGSVVLAVDGNVLAVNGHAGGAHQAADL